VSIRRRWPFCSWAGGPEPPGPAKDPRSQKENEYEIKFVYFFAIDSNILIFMEYLLNHKLKLSTSVNQRYAFLNRIGLNKK
jgi:hypothetical protein